MEWSGERIITCSSGQACVHTHTHTCLAPTQSCMDPICTYTHIHLCVLHAENVVASFTETRRLVDVILDDRHLLLRALGAEQSAAVATVVFPGLDTKVSLAGVTLRAFQPRWLTTKHLQQSEEQFLGGHG
eukprot:scpid54866/ scgid33033/ 